ncbi:hypothetical protein Sbal117_2046 [Shewanella baltica OS117]|nr:hypothetical protein Sbal117_2046 [Shewanella baltica OS117]
MLMTVEQAKLFCKKKNIKHLDIRSSTCVRMMFKLNSKLYRMALCTGQPKLDTFS